MHVPVGLDLFGIQSTMFVSFYVTIFNILLDYQLESIIDAIVNNCLLGTMRKKSVLLTAPQYRTLLHWLKVQLMHAHALTQNSYGLTNLRPATFNAAS